jgi:hypothetical protein
MGPMEIWYYNLMDCEIETLQLPDRCRLFVILSDLIKESGLGFCKLKDFRQPENGGLCVDSGECQWCAVSCSGVLVA